MPGIFKMRLRLLPSLSVILIPFLAAASAAAQQAAPAQQAPAKQPAAPSPSDQSVATLHMQAREVLLPVTVRDKKGALVTNLSKTDFTLTEDGRPQAIKSFSVESNLPFRVGLLVDTSRSVSGAMNSERKAAAKFLDQMLTPAKPAAGSAPASAPAGGSVQASMNNSAAAPASGQAKADPAAGKDQAFLLHFDREVELLQDFTSSTDKLHHEIDEMGPSTSQERYDRDGPETTGDTRDRSQFTRGGTELYDAIFLASDELMKPKDGRKALVIFSDGVDRGSKETMNEALDAAEHANLTIYAIYFRGEEEHPMGGSPGRRGGMGGGWPGGGGGGYPGGRREPRSEQSSVDGRKIMEQIAERTGGRYFDTKKKEDLEEIYGLIAEELRGQYLLSYTPDKVDNEGGYHKVSLTPSNKDLTVITRAGYFAPGGDSGPK